MVQTLAWVFKVPESGRTEGRIQSGSSCRILALLWGGGTQPVWGSSGHSPWFSAAAQHLLGHGRPCSGDHPVPEIQLGTCLRPGMHPSPPDLPLVCGEEENPGAFPHLPLLHLRFLLPTFYKNTRSLEQSAED